SYHLFFVIVVVSCTVAHFHLHSFPTRRSSDLEFETPIKTLTTNFDSISKSIKDFGFSDKVVSSLEKLITLISTSGVSAFTVFSTDRKSTRLNSSHVSISYAVFCFKTQNLRKDT